MNKHTITLFCLLVATPLVSHSMLRTIAYQMKTAPVMARTMATLSNAQKNLMQARLKQLESQKNLELSNAQKQWEYSDKSHCESLRVVAYAHASIASKNRAFKIEKQIFNIELKLAEDKKD